MNLPRLLILTLGVVLIALGYAYRGWAGVAAVTGALVMLLLLQVTRAMALLRRAAQRPVGYVDNAVMLHTRLKHGMALMHVIAFTQTLGERRSEPGQEPECYRWTDPGGTCVDAQFRMGKLYEWTLARPTAAALSTNTET